MNEPFVFIEHPDVESQQFALDFGILLGQVLSPNTHGAANTLHIQPILRDGNFTNQVIVQMADSDRRYLLTVERYEDGRTGRGDPGAPQAD